MIIDLLSLKNRTSSRTMKHKTPSPWPNCGGAVCPAPGKFPA